MWEDVDVSAYAKRARRPAYEDMKQVIAAGKVDGVLVWKLDRLVRRVVDFERFWVRCDQADVFLASATEPIDSTTELGLAVIRILVTFASVESTSIGLRLRARMEEKARSGIPLVHGREFGFNEHWDKIVEGEAALIREAADRFLAGEGLDSIVDDWRRRQIRPLRGTEWTRRKLTRILASPRTAGDNTFNCVVVARGCFPAILDPLTSAQLQSRLADKSTGSTTRSYLLSSGLLRCGICGARMHGSTSKSRHGSRGPVRSYVCGRRGAQGHSVSINAEVVEEIITKLTLDRIERQARLRRTLPSPDDAPEQLREAYETHAAAVRALTIDYYVKRSITREEWEIARDGLDDQLRQAIQADAPRLRPRTPMEAKRFRLAWERLDDSHRRDIIASELHFAIVTPKISGRVIDARRVQPTWWSDSPMPQSRPRRGDSLDATVWDSTSWMGTSEAAEILGVSSQTVGSMIRSGQLHGIKHRRILRIPRSDVESMAASFAGTIRSIEVATALGVAQHRVDHWLEGGLLPGRKLGGFWRVRVDDLNDFATALRALQSALIGTTDAARLLDRCVPWIIELANRGELDCIRHRRKYLLRRDQVEAMAAHSVTESAKKVHHGRRTALTE